jgi:hypothetical protein
VVKSQRSETHPVLALAPFPIGLEVSSEPSRVLALHLGAPRQRNSLSAKQKVTSQNFCWHVVGFQIPVLSALSANNARQNQNPINSQLYQTSLHIPTHYVANFAKFMHQRKPKYYRHVNAPQLCKIQLLTFLSKRRITADFSQARHLLK